MLDVVNSDDVGEVSVSAAEDAATFGEGEGGATIEVHGFVTAEGLHDLGFAQERHGGEKGDVEKLLTGGKTYGTPNRTSHHSRVSESFFAGVNGHGARSE